MVYFASETFTHCLKNCQDIKNHWALLQVLEVACHKYDFVIINVQNVVWSTNAEIIAANYGFCMMFVICVRKDVLILGSAYKTIAYDT